MNNTAFHVSCYSIEGNSQWLDGGAMFGNVPRPMWEKWIQPDDRNRIPLSCRALLVKGLNGKNVLFETGIGAFFDPKLKDRFGVREDEHVLLRSLAARGLSHEQIDFVVLSHLHFDHAGGLLTAYAEGREAELLFPRARFVVSELAWERAQRPHLRDRASFIPRIAELLAKSGRLELVHNETCKLLGACVRFHYSNGHTPGLMLSEIGPESGGGIVYCGDLIPGRAWVHVPVTMGYDRAPELLIDEKKSFLRDMTARKNWLFFTHDHYCAMARIVEQDGKYIVHDELPTVESFAVAVSTT